jgi:hypothetical protein
MSVSLHRLMPNSSYGFADFRTDFDGVSRIASLTEALVPALELRMQYFQGRYKHSPECSPRMRACVSAFEWWLAHRGSLNLAARAASGESAAPPSATVVYVLWALWTEAAQPLAYDPPVGLVETLCRALPRVPATP